MERMRRIWDERDIRSRTIRRPGAGRRSRQAAVVHQTVAHKARLPGAIKLVMEQLESMAPGYTERNG
jgi:hypothetical protein